MLNASQQLLRDESGLTLIELLIVMLVSSILAMLAMPAFGNQVSKARDARAKQAAHNAAVAIETCRLQSAFGSYANCSAEVLRALDPTLPPKAELKVNGLGETTYTVVITSEPSSQKFRIKRNAKGVYSYPCTTKGTGGCPADGNWGD